MILCIGEILVDLIGKKENNVITYSRYAGGAPFNVACGISKFGGKVQFIGNVGNDLFGKFLIDFTRQFNFDKVTINQDDNHNTTLAIVENDEYGERSFSFYRKNTADYLIKHDQLESIKNADIIHFGSLMLSKEEGRKVADEIISLAKKYQKKISFDINYRDDIFNDKTEAIQIYKKFAEKADIIKYSLDELILFTGINDYQVALNKIAQKDQIVFLTLGKEGSVFYQNKRLLKVPSIAVKPVDTTGAGDAFYAGILTNLDMNSFKIENDDTLIRMLRFANIAGALVTTKLGAIDSIPSLDEINNLLKKISS